MATVHDLRFQHYVKDSVHRVDHPFPRSSSDLDALHMIWLGDVGMVQSQLGRRATIDDLKNIPVRDV